MANYIEKLSIVMIVPPLELLLSEMVTNGENIPKLSSVTRTGSSHQFPLTFHSFHQSPPWTIYHLLPYLKENWQSQHWFQESHRNHCCCLGALPKNVPKHRHRPGFTLTPESFTTGPVRASLTAWRVLNGKCWLLFAVCNPYILKIYHGISSLLPPTPPLELQGVMEEMQKFKWSWTFPSVNI